MSKTTNTDELKAQAEKSNIIYSESLEGILPADLVSEEIATGNFSLNLSETNYDLKLISIKKTKKGNICSFKIYNFNSINFLQSDYCLLFVEGKSYRAKLIEIFENEDLKDNANIITVLLEA